MSATSSDANRILDLADDIDAKGEKGIAQQLRNVAWALRNRLAPPDGKEAISEGMRATTYEYTMSGTHWNRVQVNEIEAGE